MSDHGIRGGASAVLALLLCAELLAGCEQAAKVTAIPSATLAAELISDAPPGYHVNAGATGPLDRRAASYSTPAGVGQTQDVLSKQHFAGGYARVWQNGPDYITASIYGFEKASGATAFNAFEATMISGEQGSFTYALTQPSNGTGFVITTRNKTGSRNVFCQGGMFSVDRYAFIVQTCGQQPNSSDTANSLAAAAYFHATVRVFQQPSPSP